MKFLRKLGLAVTLLCAAPAWAQSPGPQPQTEPRQQEIKEQQERQVTQPGNNAPVWRNVQSGTPNYTSIPGRETAVLIQPPARFPGQQHITTAGEAWRQFRNGPVTFYGGSLVVAVLVAILAFYFWKGPVKLHDAPTGRLIRPAAATEERGPGPGAIKKKSEETDETHLHRLRRSGHRA